MSSPIFTRCNFNNNSAATGDGGAIYNNGEKRTASPVFNECTFRSNSASNGGAMYNYGDNGNANPLVYRCQFIQNSSTGNGGVFYNEAVIAGEANVVSLSSIFSRNSSASNGGVMYNSSDGNNATFGSDINFALINSSFSQNTATSGGAIIYTTVTNNAGGAGTNLETTSRGTISNSLFRGNRASGTTNLWTRLGTESTLTINYSMVETASGAFPAGVTASDMQFATDPLFTDPNTDDLSLQATSPAIDIGDLAALNAFVLAYNAVTTPAITINDLDDLPGEDRVLGTVDMGAYEYGREIDVKSGTPLVSIIDGDVTPDIADNTDFGTTNTGASISRTFTIENVGNIGLDVSSITSSAAEFTITGFTPTVTVAGNTTTTFDVVLSSATVGTFTSTISIANNDADENPYTFDVSGVVTTPPTPPTPPVTIPRLTGRLSIDSVFTDQVNLSWTSTSGVTSYEIYQNGILIATVPAGQNSYVVTGLTPNDRYTFRLVAINSAGRSNPLVASTWTVPLAPTFFEPIDSICGTGRAQVAVSSSGSVYRVYPSPTSTTVLLTSENGRFNLPLTTSDTVFYISVIGRGGDESERLPVFVNIQDPITAVIQGDVLQRSCDNSLTLNALPVEGAIYSWQRNGTEVGQGETYTASVAGSYRLIVKKGVCTAISERVTVQLNQLPIAQIEQIDNIEFCQTGQIDAVANQSIFSYNWIFEGDTVGTDQNLIVQQTGNYTLSVTNEIGCVSTTSINVRITELPEPPSVIASILALCPNERTTLSINNTQTDIRYEWYRNGRLLRSENSDSLVNAIAGVYRVRAIRGTCSFSSEPIVIERIELSPLYINYTDESKSEITLTSEQDIVSVIWYLDGEEVTSLANQTTIAPQETGSYFAIATYSTGCEARTTCSLYYRKPVVTSNEEDEKDKFVLYPNPSSGYFIIHLANPLTSPASIQIVDALGRLITKSTLEQDNKKFEFDLGDNLSKGLYLIKLEIDGKVSTHQLIIE